MTLAPVNENAVDDDETADLMVSGSIGYTVGSPSSATGTILSVEQDTTIQGNWIGTYGSQGYNVIGNTASYPSYATVTPVGATTGTFVANTTDPRRGKMRVEQAAPRGTGPAARFPST